jgi:hypothetical protein
MPDLLRFMQSATAAAAISLSSDLAGEFAAYCKAGRRLAAESPNSLRLLRYLAEWELAQEPSKRPLLRGRPMRPKHAVLPKPPRHR